MSKVNYHGREVIIHEGPMADKRGTSWREDAARLEALDEARKENRGKTFPNQYTTLDKEHAARAKGDGGTVDPEEALQQEAGLTPD